MIDKINIEKNNKTVIKNNLACFCWIDDVFEKAYFREDVSKEFVLDGQLILDAVLTIDKKSLIVETKSSIYFGTKDNDYDLSDKNWVDYYYEPKSNSFYRKDKRGFWYDTEGVRLKSTVILKDDILISLGSKSSKQNQIFSDQKPYTSPNKGLIQIGKIVLDNSLNPVYYYSERITGLGSDTVIFEDRIVYQQVYLGLSKPAFIQEDTKEPFCVDGNEIDILIDQIEIGEQSFYVLKSKDITYYLNKSTGEKLEFDGISSAIIDIDSYVQINKNDIVKIVSNRSTFYYNITLNTPFYVSGLDRMKIVKIERSNVVINNQELYNIYSDSKSVVVNTELSQYRSSKFPEIERFKNIPGFQNIFAFVVIDGKQQLFSLQSEELILLENDTIVAIDGHAKNKLLNAITANGQRIVLDLRKGFNEMVIAKTRGNILTQTESEPYKIGSKILQNVKIETLGGVQERVVDINTEELDVFKLPDSLMTYTEGDEISVFAGTELIAIDFSNVIKLGNRKFVSAKFRTYDDELQTVILDNESGRPLRMDGLGHKLELVTKFKNSIHQKEYMIGPHVMVGAITLREDLRKNEVLFSSTIMSSWIPFSDNYIPLLKQVVEINEQGAWEHNLFELITLDSEKEYIAVEKSFPNRVLAKSKGGKQEIIVVTSKEKVLKSPHEISIISKLFNSQSQILAEVY